jgi:steroid 5-alpha reductase family enzyme
MEAYIGGALVAFGLFQLGAVFGLIFRRNDIADVLWGPGFPLTALGALSFMRDSGRSVELGVTEHLILAALIIWAVRLAFYVGRRYWKKGQEDVRYNNWRKQWGSTWVWRSYLQVFVLQPLILFVIALAFLHAMDKTPRELTALVVAGAVIWAFGFIFEALADDQLRRFQADSTNKGKIMDRGLWGWSRHPNYFGEVAQWWGIFFMCVTIEGWWTVVSPIALTFLVIKVSGVDMLEALMEKRAGWADYKARVSVFFPLPPK